MATQPQSPRISPRLGFRLPDDGANMPVHDAVQLAQLLQTGKYSDMTLVCAGKEFKLHKMVVCSVSRHCCCN